MFALAYERASRHAGVATALAVAIVASLASAPSLHWLAGALAPALFVAVVVSPAVQAALPRSSDSPQPGRPRGEVVITALASGTVTSVVALCATSVGPFWTGVLASPPLVAAAVVIHQHRTAGHAAVCGFLHGYVGGLLGRAVFGAGFAILIAPVGVTTATLIASLVGGGLGVAASYLRGPAKTVAAPQWLPPSTSARPTPR